jgi:penicillin amidase
MLAIRDVLTSRPVRTVKALLMRAVDATSARADRLEKEPIPSHVERVRGVEATVTIARDAHGVPGVFAGSLPDLAFGLGWACAEDRLFQMELSRRSLRGELAATFGPRAADARALSSLVRGRTFVDLDAFVRALDFRRAAEESYALASAEGRAWVDAYAAGVNAFLASGRRPVEMLLLDLEPTPWSGADCLLIAKGTAFQLTFSYRFALARALVEASVEPAKAKALFALAHPLGVTRGDVEALAPVVATTELLRAVLGADGLHLGSNAIALAPSRSTTGRAMVASDPHMPLTAPSVFWEFRAAGGGLDLRGLGVPGWPAALIGQNARGAWGVTAGWGDDSQVWCEDLARLRAEGRLTSRTETILVKGEAPRALELLRSPRGAIVSQALDLEGPGLEARAGGDVGIALRWSGLDATLDADASLAAMRAGSFDELRGALRQYGGATINVVWADADGHIGWQYAGRVPRRAGNLGDEPRAVSGLDLLDGDDPRGHWQGYVPFDELPFVRDPKSGVIASANARPHGPGYRHQLGELFEPPFRMARLLALADSHGRLGPRELAAVQRDARSAWATQLRDRLLAGLDDVQLGLPLRRGLELVRLARAWDGVAHEQSVGATATYALLHAALRHVFLEDLGEEAFERYFEIMNVSALPLLQALGDSDGPWLRDLDRATIVRDAAAMAESRLRRRLGDDPARWTWGALHTVTFRHAFAELPGLRAIASPGPFPARGDGTTVCMGEFDLHAGEFAVRCGPAARVIMPAGDPRGGRVVLPPGQSGEPSSRHYRDQITPWLAGEDRAASWAETDFVGGRRLRLVPA